MSNRTLLPPAEPKVAARANPGPSGPPRGRRGGRLRYAAKVAFASPTSLVGLLALALFVYLIVVPIVSMLSDAFRVQLGDDIRSGQPFGTFTVFYLQRVFTGIIAGDVFWTPLVHTLQIAIGAIVIALVVGGVMAYFVSRTNMFGRKWFATALIVPYMLPSWTFALAWTTLFKNRTVGGQLGWIEVFGVEPPNWIAYGQLPITTVLGLHYAPFVILLFGNALRNLDSQLEDSAQMLGAGRGTVLVRVVIPLMRPALLSAATLIFAKCIGDFGTAYVLGLPVKYDVLATSLYRSVSTGQTGSAAVLAGAIIVIGIVTVVVDARLVREARRFVTIGGKGSMDRTLQLRFWRAPATALAVLVFTTSVVVPIMTLLLSTVMRVPGDFRPSNFTLDFWLGHDLHTVALRQGVLLTPDLWHAVWNTVWIVGLAALVAGLLGVFVGYIVVRTPIRPLGSALRFITFLPYLVPGIAFAVAYLSLFAVPRGPIPALYGTSAILVVALIAEQMPYASRSGISAMMQLGSDPEEAAQVAGAGWFRRMLQIIVPIQRNSLASGVLLPFISGVKGLSLVVILAVPGTDLLTTYSLRLVDYGYQQAANAVVLMIAVVSLVGTLVGQKLTKSSLANGL